MDVITANEHVPVCDKMIVADTSKGVKIDASVVAKPFRDEIKQKVTELKRQGIGKLISQGTKRDM